jgi:type IV pilus assembly protein PilM
MNLKKEFKVSGLVRSKAKAGTPKKAKVNAKKTRGRKSGHDPKTIVGLELGTSQIAAAVVSNNGGKHLVKLHREPLATGIMTGGEVRDPIALGVALKEFFDRYGLPRKNVRLGLANSRVGIRQIDVSDVEDETQLPNAISFRAHETLSIPIDESVMDYVVDETTNEDGTIERSAVVTVAYRESIDRYLTATSTAGLDVIGIDFEAFALLRALSEPAGQADEPRETAVVAVCVGHERTTLAVSDGHICSFARVLDWGGDNLTNAVARGAKISPAEAEEAKQELSLEPGAEPPAGLTSEATDDALHAIKIELGVLVRELLSSLRFYQSQPGSLALREILLSGGTTAMTGFAAELERELGVQVVEGDPLSRVKSDVEVPGALGSFAVAIGLGIED